MRRTMLAVCAVTFALSAARAGAETPPFAANDAGAVKVPKLIEWMGSVEDLSAATTALPSALGLPAHSDAKYLDRDGRKIKYETDYLSGLPIWPGAMSTITYKLYESPTDFDEVMLRLFGNAPRARIDITLNQSEACISVSDMISHFGPNPQVGYMYGRSSMYPPHAKVYGWTLRPQPPITEVSAVFAADGKGCSKYIVISEHR